MKYSVKYIGLLLMSFFVMAGSAFAQQFDREMQYFTYPDQRGLNQFEAPFETNVEFDGVNVRIGGANALQFQALRHDNAGPWAGTVNGVTVTNTLTDLGSNFNLATSNLDLDVALADGLRMHLRTYLSSRHHPEPYVKGGYMQVDRLDFISEGFASGLMDHLRIKVGHMEVNYGDNHFRRTDNAAAIYNPFVGNYIMDSFTTEVGGEVYYYTGNMFAMVGVTNTKLNQSVAKGPVTNKGSFVGKVGYDSQLNEDLRIRLTGSIYTTPQAGSIYLYDGDRAGARYYEVMSYSNSEQGTVDSFRSGRFDPGFNNEITAIMINPFIKYKGFEFYGVFENTSGKNIGQSSRTFNQYGAELLYRFGAGEDIYLGGRYNLVSGKLAGGQDVDIDRINLGGGWFLTKNVLAKLEYVTQSYDGFTGQLQDGEFNGIMLEAVISF